MNKFGKLALAGLTGLSLAGTALYAHARGPGEHDCHMAGFDKSKMTEYAQKHQARLHDKLKLSAEQENAWQTFAATMKPGERPERPAADKLKAMTAPERADYMLSRVKEGEKRMEAHAAAVKAFYAVLTPEQQKVFDAEAFPFAHGRMQRGERGGRPQAR